MSGKPRKPPSPLVEAAQAFEEELQSYASLSEAFVRAPLDSAKHLERASELLGEIAGSEQRLGDCGRQLAEAVGAARDDQERRAQGTLARVPVLKQRTAELAGLLKQLQELGAEAVGLNETAALLAKRGPVGQDGNDGGQSGAEDRAGAADAARKMSEAIAGLSRRAQQVAVSAREHDFEDIARQAHALHQQLLAAHRKLHLAAGAPAPTNGVHGRTDEVS